MKEVQLPILNKQIERANEVKRDLDYAREQLVDFDRVTNHPQFSHLRLDAIGCGPTDARLGSAYCFAIDPAFVPILRTLYVARVEALEKEFAGMVIDGMGE